MLVLLITVVTTTNVYATSYVADDTSSISSQYHDIFNNYFSKSVSYQYFSYKCHYGNSDRNCYFGIDNDGNFLRIVYQANGNSYIQKYEKGVDEDFSVSGVNVFRKEIDNVIVTNYILSFVFVLTIVFILTHKYV